MKNKLFDEHVKQQFDGYRPEVAPHIWENIVSEKNKVKPAPLWLSFFTGGRMIAALFVLAIGGAIFYFADTDDNTNTEKTNTATEKNITAPQQNTSANNITNNSPVTDNGSSVNGNDINTIAADQSNNNTTSNTDAVAQTDNSRLKNNTTTSSINTTADKINTNNSNVAANRRQQRINIKPKTAVSVTEGTVEFADNSNKKITSREKYLKSNFGDLDLLRTYALSGPGEPSLIIPKIPKNKNLPCPEIEKDAAGNKTYLEVYGGPDYVFSSFSDTANSSYLQKRKSTGSMMFAFSAGVRYTRVFSNGISVRTGINYSQFNERFKYVSGNVTHNIYITTPSGDTTGTYTETGTLYKSGTNIYRTLDVPLTLGYEMGNGRLHANVNAGAMINIRSKQSGYVLDPNGTPVDISSGKQSSVYGYRTNVGISFLGGVSFYYKLNDKFHLLAEPYFRYSLSPMTKTDISLTQKNHTAGLRFGLRMDLH